MFTILFHDRKNDEVMDRNRVGIFECNGDMIIVIFNDFDDVLCCLLNLCISHPTYLSAWLKLLFP